MSDKTSHNDGRQCNKPSFSGNTMPIDINPNLCMHDNVGDEVTRRVGVFQPSFEPISSFQPPTMNTFDSQLFNGLMKDEVMPQSGTVSKSTPKPSSSISGIWRLDDVPTLPEFHPLERTSVFVPNVISVSDISLRISDTLRSRSIDATYDNDKAKATCTTLQGVEFRVRLYRGRNRFNHGVIVEVQRRFGTSNSFHNDTTAILDAAEGNVVSSPATDNSSDLPLVVSDVEDESEASVDGTSSIAMISKMLSHPGYDSHYLALQTLSSLTDSSKMGSSTACAASKELFRLDNDNEVGAKILSLIIDKQGDDDTFNLRTMSLNVAANAFQAVDGKFPQMLKEQLRGVLLRDLRCAKDNQRNAIHAARIIQYFVPDDNGSDMYTALEAAQDVGMSRNALLERYVRICLDKYN